MKNEKPTVEEWKKLYNAAFKVKENECWNIFNDDDIFGIKDPETGMIGLKQNRFLRTSILRALSL